MLYQPTVGDRFHTKGGVYVVKQVTLATLTLCLFPDEGKGDFEVARKPFLVQCRDNGWRVEPLTQDPEPKTQDAQ